MSRENFSEERFRSLVEVAPDGVLLYAGGKVLFANPAGALLLGASTPEELVGKPIASLVEPGSRAMLEDEAGDGTGAAPGPSEEKMLRLDGTVIDVEAVRLASTFEDQLAQQLVLRDITQRKQTEAALRESERRYRSLFEGVPVGVYRISKRGELVLFNGALVELLGAPNREMLEGFDTGSLYVEEEDREAWKVMMQYEGRVESFETRIRRLDGTKIWVRSYAQALRDAKGAIIGYEAIFEDVTDRKRAEDALRTSEERFRSLVQNASDMITILDRQRRVLYQSPASVRLLGFEPSERAGTDGFEQVHPQDRQRLDALFADLLENPRKSQRLEYRMRHADGSWRVLESKITNLLENPAVCGMVINSRDVSDRKRAEDQLLHDALHDALTGLPNRSLFMDRLGHCVERRSREKDYRCAVLFLDLDRFKMVNDSYGHAVGDQLLVQASHRLKGCLRPNDSLARLGGDEFAVLLDDVKDASNAVRVAKRIQQELEMAFQLGGRELYSSASIGIALSADTGPEDILRDADTAMYRAKSDGRAGYAIFDAEMHAQVRAQLQLETDLRRGLAKEQFDVFYQPIVALPGGALAGFEALARWHHPARGLVSAGEFLETAEETGLIDPIGRRVLLEACRQTKVWNDRRAPREPIFVSVNMSNRQLSQPDLVIQVRQALDSSGLAGDRLFLEVTEGAVSADPETVLETLVRLKRLGVRISLDDFGTGMSSLSVLHRFPFDRIKIDAAFVRHIGVDSGSDELMEGIVALCHGKRLETIAEGVETDDQHRRLADLGCSFAQGFLFSEPVDKGKAEELMTAAPLGFN
ncbi:MAG: EAL domain-containing protein [bacterium]|nr:EAL domain-containing protein [bacterium]